MNKIVGGLLNSFKQAHKLDPSLSESEIFEYFVAHLIIGSISETTSTTSHTVVGGNAQPAVDVIGIIVNGTLIENEDEIETFISINSYLDVDFIFAQAKTSEGFDVPVLGELGEFANNFIEDDTCDTDTEHVLRLRNIKNAIYNESKHFRRRNPNCYIYYVTTGIKPENDIHFNHKITKIKKVFSDNASTLECNIQLVGAKEIQELKRLMDNSIAREILFNRKVSLPLTPGIDEAYIGVVSAPIFISLLEGHGGNMLSSIFYDNVRDWQGDNLVNSGIATTLKNKSSKTRFVFMNNGITIIAKKIRSTGDKILLEDYQIVNGCQTSNVLWSNKAELDDNVLIPLRIVATTDEAVVMDIIRATNSQTEVTASQLLAATDFQKQLEKYFEVQSPIALHYERRSKQFSSSPVDRTEILTPISLMKAYASIILEEPHKTTRDFQSIVSKAGTSIFGKKHKIELYYMAALAQYWIDQFLRKGIIDRSLTVARFQILLAFRLLNEAEGMPPVESNRSSKWALNLISKLKDQQSAELGLLAASGFIEDLIGSRNKRDAVRSGGFTDEVKLKIKTAKAKLKKSKLDAI